MMHRKSIILFLFVWLLSAFSWPGVVWSGDEAFGVRLALRLSEEGDQRSSAIEFRRLGISVDDDARRAAYFWSAAYQYWRAGEPLVADTMLDHAEDYWPPIEASALLLRAESAASRHDVSETGFYWESLIRSDPEVDTERLARRRLAAIRLRQGQLEASRTLLIESPAAEEAALHALAAYEQGRDKKPFVGGLLGIIPGMGYAYAGEYANAFRSLLLNAIFIYGMVDTARNNHWGGFAAITFFELTWYSGSIYGGVDASHRYNERRLHQTLDAIEGQASFEPDWRELPVISVRYAF